MTTQAPNLSASRISSSAAEEEQQLFTDTLLRVQVHHVRAKEEHQLGKIPIPHYAKACALLDNFPLPFSSSSPPSTSSASFSSTTTTTPSSTSSLTRQQIALITSLRQDHWAALAEACLEAKDWVQADAALMRLVALYEQAAGPEFQKPRGKKKNKNTNNARNENILLSREIPSNLTTTDASKLPATSASSSTGPETQSEPEQRLLLTEEQLTAARALVQTLTKLQDVTDLLGKQQLARNIGVRIDKFQARLALEDEHRRRVALA